jgi:hypothetical protein
MRKHHRAKLPFETVKQIRAEHLAYVRGYEMLAKKFGCGASTVRDICTFRTRILQ